MKKLFAIMLITPLAGTLAYAQVPGQFSRIEQVDFFNFTYPTGPSDCSNPPPHGRKTVTLKRGMFVEVVRDKDSRFELKYAMDKKDIAFGDITGSPTGEAVIALRCNFMSNFWTPTTYVYTLRDGTPGLLAKISGETLGRDYEKYYPGQGPIWDITGLRAGNGKIVIDTMVDAPHACPKNLASLVYAWNGKTVVMAGKPVKRSNPSC